MDFTPKQRVRAALKAPSSDLQRLCEENTTQVLDLLYVARRSSELGAPLKQAVWSLLEKNMRVLCAASSLGWDAKKKHAEMFHRFSRFILVFQGPEPLAENLVAFSMFRFENEEEYCVLYCYELQVNEEMRGMGIGRCLMNVLECIGSEWRMQKLMLTVLKANKNAVKFYATVGFQIDVSSPTNFGYKEDYEILSRVLEEEDFDFDEAPPNTNH